MKVWKGILTSGSLSASVRLIKDNKIEQLKIVNTTESLITVNVKVQVEDSSDAVYLSPTDVSLAAGEVYVDWDIALDDREQLVVESSGEATFRFTFTNDLD